MVSETPTPRCIFVRGNACPPQLEFLKDGFYVWDALLETAAGPDVDVNLG